MIETKFRGKRKGSSIWFYGGYAFGSYDMRHDPKTFKHYIITDAMAIIEVDHESLGQHTGLGDKKGKEIYAGDLVKFDDSEYAIGEVWWQPSGAYFAIDWSKSTQPELDVRIQHHSQLEVVGNIYDNPDLIGVSNA